MDQILKNTEAKKQQFSAMDNQYDSIYHEIESLQQSTKLHLIEVEHTIFSTNEKIAELELNSLRACADDALRKKPAIPAVPISLVTIRKDYEQQRRIIRQAIMKGGELLQRAKPNLSNASVPSDDSTVCHTQSRLTSTPSNVSDSNFPCRSHRKKNGSITASAIRKWKPYLLDATCRPAP